MILLTRDQVIQHMSMIKLKHGYIVDTSTNQYWKIPLGSGTTPDISMAIRDTIHNLYNTVLSWGGGNFRFELVDQELAEKLTRYKCSAHTVLGASLIKMLEMAPANPSIRAQVMAIVGQMPPPELDTCDKIREWVELTHDPKVKVAEAVSESTVRLHFGVRVNAFRAVSGRCTYSGTEAGGISPNLQDKIEEYIRAQGTGNLSLRTLADLIRAEALRQTREIPIDELELEENYDSFSHEDHEVTREGDVDYSLPNSHETTMDLLKNHIQAYYPREVQRRFGL